MSETGDSQFSEEQQRILSCVLDQIIPPSSDAKMPGAGEIGLVGYIEKALEKAPELRPVIADGLAAINAIAADRGAADFENLDESQRPEVLEGLATTHPGFLPSLLFHTFTGYYQNPRVNAALGIETQPPFPKGFSLEQGDLSLLDVVKQKPKMYREV